MVSDLWGQINAPQTISVQSGPMPLHFLKPGISFQVCPLDTNQYEALLLKYKIYWHVLASICKFYWDNVGSFQLYHNSLKTMESQTD